MRTIWAIDWNSCRPFEFNSGPCVLICCAIGNDWLCPARSAGFLNPLTRKIHFLFGNRRYRSFSNKKCAVGLRLTSSLKSGDFWRKSAILRLTSYFKSGDFGRKYAILWLTSFLKNDDFGRTYAILRLTSFLKSNDFGRKSASCASCASWDWSEPWNRGIIAEKHAISRFGSDP